MIARFLRRGLWLALAMLALVVRNWRLWLATALLGAVMFAARAATEPRLWVSEGSLTLQPLILREGYLLSARELTGNYTLRLGEEQRVARVLDGLGYTEAPDEVLSHLMTSQQPTAGTIRLQVEHPDPARAEALTRALLLDFQQEVEAENRTREELDRLVIAISPTSFARPVNAPVVASAVKGFGLGLMVGVGLVLLRRWLQRNRIAMSLEAEQLTGAPTLGAIPRR
jgi:hypothetical protein